MKKFAILGAVLFALVASTAFVGCTPEVQGILAPKDTWIRDEYTKNGNQLVVCCYYASGSYKITPKHTGGKEINLDNGGLVLVIYANSDSEVLGGLTSKKYAVYTAEKGVKKTEGTEGDQIEFSASDSLWTTLGTLRTFSAKPQSSSAPSPLVDTGWETLENWSNLKEFLAEYLTTQIVKKLLGV